MLLICMAGIAACFGLYYLFDNVWNGSFLDWFEMNYMVSYDTVDSAGRVVIIREPDWYSLKQLLMGVFTAGVVIWLAVVCLVVYFYAPKKISKSITKISQMLRDYMIGEKEAAEVFPKDYAEIASQMTEIKSSMQRNEQMLKDETSRKNDLIVYLAHDLKTPLTSVVGYLSLLDEAGDMPSAQRKKYITIALDKALRLEKLINEFFEITRYNLQQIILEKETIDLHYMLVQMTDEFYPLLNAHGNTAELYAAENITVYGDPVKLARVFNNVLKNAIAYSYPGTAIEIRAEARAEEIRIVFRNKGKTIPKQKLNAIFEKFFRLDEARATNTGGAGLGLAIAREIVTLHGGEIKADSENEVTTFCISLPTGN